MYKTELHLHSAAISRCANAPDEDIVQRYVQAGYHTVVLANHFNRFTFDYWKFTDYHTFVDAFCEARDNLQAAAGDRLRVLLGAEFRFDDNINDYLVFGLNRELLHATPNVWAEGLKAYRSFADAHGLLICQAHPFRDGMTVMDPNLLDGMEVFNGHPGHDSRNAVALAWAERYGLIRTSGTDRHNVNHSPMGGIVTDTPVEDMETLVRTLREGTYTWLAK